MNESRESVIGAVVKEGAYDDDAAHGLMKIFADMARSSIDPAGIFIVEVDKPLRQNPERGIAYDIAGMTTKDVGDWIRQERSNIERGWSAGTPQMLRGKPSWEAVLAGLGDLTQGFLSARIVSPATAEEPPPTISCDRAHSSWIQDIEATSWSG
jgi:hypothetical protein